MTVPAPLGVILAAGKGTRMAPFSDHYPKPILPVANRPLIAHQLEILRGLGTTDVLIVIGHLGHEVVRALGEGERYGMRIRYVEQEEMLGIAHALSRLEPHVDRPFFLFLGDIFFETENLGSMLERLRSSRGVHGVLAVKREPDLAAIKRNFIVMTEPDGRVTRVIEKPRHPRTDIKGCGIYLFDPAFFDAVRRTPRTAMRDEYEITDAIQIFLDDGYRVEAAEVIKSDLNLSYPRDLLELNLQLLDRSGATKAVGTGSRLHPGVTLQRSIVMEGAVIENPIRLSNCLVFPHTVVRHSRDLTATILTQEKEIRCDD